MEAMPFIGRQLVQKHLKYPALISAVKRALEEYSANRASQPLRISFSVGNTNRTFLTMPSYSASDHTLSTKLVSMYPNNMAKHNLPSHLCYVMVFDPDNGKLKCVMDGELITLMRTAAASVVATQAVASSPDKKLAILGSGEQARSHIQAFNETYAIEKLTVWSRNFENAQKLCNEFQHLRMHNCKTVKEAVKDADVVVTVTHATEPILRGQWLKPGSHVNCVGACRPMWRECDDDCMKNSIVYVDSYESARNESGDIVMSKCDIQAEIGEILLKQKKVEVGQRTFFKSLGLALEDAVAANLVWQGLEQSGELTQ